MKIIIIGAGKVGYALATHLSAQGNDITIIDNNPKALEKVENNLDVLPVKGTGISTSTLLENGCRNIDLIIAVTGSDEVNMLCCLTAKKLGAHRTIARIRDPQYAKELLLIKEDLGLDMVINPEEAAADEIARVLTVPGAIRLENFAKGRVRMVEVLLKEGSPLIGTKMKHFGDKFGVSVLIGAIIREDKLIIPTGDTALETNDTIYAIGKSAAIYTFCKRIHDKPCKVKNIMIVGGGKIAYYLARLLNEMHIKVKIIEKDSAVCERLSDELPNTLIIHGDGTDSELLAEEHLEAVDSFIALTGRDEENIISSLIAKQSEVPRVVTKISRHYSNAVIGSLGLDTIITPHDIITNRILKYVRGEAVEALHRIVGGEGEIIEFIASANDPLIHIPLYKLRLIPDVLIATIVKKNEIVVPNGQTMINPGDRVLVITNKNISHLKDIMDTTSGGITGELKNSIKKLGNIINL